METKKPSVSANAINYGLITGAVMIVYSLILYIANLYMNRNLGYISYVFLVAGMGWGTFELRKKYENGLMTYGEAFISCFLIGLFAGILSTIYIFVFAKFINPGFINEILEQSRVQMQARNMNDDQIETAMEYTKRFTSPVWLVIWGFVAYVFMSLVLGLIAAIFLKKTDSSAPPAL